MLFRTRMVSLTLCVSAVLPLLVREPASPAARVTPAHREPTDLPLAGLENYRVPAGRRVDDTLVVTLEAREARWRPQRTWCAA